MEKVRVRDLAKELGMKSSKEILLFLERNGQKGKSAWCPAPAPGGNAARGDPR